MLRKAIPAKKPRFYIVQVGPSAGLTSLPFGGRAAALVFVVGGKALVTEGEKK